MICSMSLLLIHCNDTGRRVLIKHRCHFFLAAMALWLCIWSPLQADEKKTVILLPIKALGNIDPKTGELVTNLLVNELAASQALSVHYSDINKDLLASFEENVGKLCTGISCQVGNDQTLQVNGLIGGELLVLAGKYIYNARIIDVSSRQVVWRESEVCKSETQLIQIVSRMSIKVRKYYGENVTAPDLRFPEDPSAGATGGPTVAVITPSVIVISAPDVKTLKPKIRQEYFIEETRGGQMLFVPEARVFIDKYEVSNFDYQQCIKEGKCAENMKYAGFTDPDQPVVGVSLMQAKDFCRWAGKRLPTEKEWILAGRGDSTDLYPWGDGLNCDLANYADCKIKKTRPVGSYISGASKSGAMDMAGNVWEWTEDGTLHGGSFREGRRKLEVAYWYNINPTTKRDDIGFRCAYSQ